MVDTKKYPRKLDEHDWMLHPARDGYGPKPTEQESKLMARRSEFQLYGEIVDRDRSYEYDEFALVGTGKADEFYLLNTTGCSCPSPTETWQIEIGPTTCEEIETFIRGGHYAGYTLPKRIEEEFIATVLHSWW